MLVSTTCAKFLRRGRSTCTTPSPPPTPEKRTTIRYWTGRVSKLRFFAKTTACCTTVHPTGRAMDVQGSFESSCTPVYFYNPACRRGDLSDAQV